MNTPVLTYGGQSSAVIDAPMAEIVDQTTNAAYIYICEAEPGSDLSEAVWRCSRLEVSTGRTTWAAGGRFSQVAANRASLAYA